MITKQMQDYLTRDGNKAFDGIKGNSTLSQKERRDARERAGNGEARDPKLANVYGGNGFKYATFNGFSGGGQGNAAKTTPSALPGNATAYQSGINVGGGIDKGGVLGGLLDTGRQADPNIAAYTRATSMNDVSQIGRAIDAQNQDLFMSQQARRSESTTQGATNIAQMYGDYNDRSSAQIGLAAEIMRNNIGFAAGLNARRG